MVPTCAVTPSAATSRISAGCSTSPLSRMNPSPGSRIVCWRTCFSLADHPLPHAKRDNFDSIISHHHQIAQLTPIIIHAQIPHLISCPPCGCTYVQYKAGVWFDYNTKMRGLFLILLLTAVWSRLLSTSDELQGTLRIKKNSFNKDSENKVLTVKAALNSPQLSNIVHQTIQVVVPKPAHGCSTMTFPEDFDGFKGTMPVYFLITGADGECSYARKVQMAKKGLAMGAIIIDSPTGINNLKLRLQEKDRFVTLLISEKDGKTLIESHDFIAELNMGGGQTKKKNQMEIWVSSLNADSYKILHQWKDVLADVSSLDSQVSWTPRFAFYSCQSGSACKSEYVSSCACGGQFCSPEQHGTSSDVLVREDIRQYLIFKESGEKYLKYVKKFFSKCFQGYSKSFYAEDCATGIMHDLDIDISINSKIDTFLSTCEEQSDDENFKIYQTLALDRAKYHQIGHYPAVILNHQQIQFRNKDQLRNVVCRKLSMEQESGCGTVTESTTIFSTIISGFFYFILFTLLLGAGGFVVLFFRNKLRRDMNKELKMQVSTAVEHYFTLSEVQH